MEHKKILLIVPEFPPHHTGGGGVVFENLAKTYQKLGHEVLVISGDHTKKNILAPIRGKPENNIQIIRIPEFYTPLSLLNTVMPIPIWYHGKLRKIIKDFSPDFTHIHGYGLFMPAQLSRICRELNIPYTFTIHGAPVSPEKMGNPIISSAYSFYHEYYGFPMLDGAERLTAVSSFARDFDIFKKWRDKIEVIGNGINPHEYRDPGYDIFTQKGIRKDKNTTIILSLGRIEWIKGFDKIIEKIPEMQKAGYDVQYVIAGRDNGYQRTLEAFAESLGVSNRVHSIGFLSGEDKMSALYHCDVLAIPSVTETYGMVALEGRVVGTPIITTFAGGLRDALDGYHFAYSLSDFQSALQAGGSSDPSISNFRWENIASRYIHTSTTNSK